jgi:DNA polymerase III alpha subunit (gram-positive type)
MQDRRFVLQFLNLTPTQWRNMTQSIYKPTRYPASLFEHIEVARGKDSFSKWIKDAAHMRLQHEVGLTPEYAQTLTELRRELTNMGRNLNQIARAASGGKPVIIDDQSFREVVVLLQGLKIQVAQVLGKLR